MHTSKFISLLKSFSKEEVKEFFKFLSSPYFNANENVIKAYKIIKGEHPDYASEKISKEYLFKKIYGNKEYADANMRYISSELLRLGEDYLAYTNLRKKKADVKKYLLAEANVRCLDKLFIRNLKASKELAEELNVNDSAYYKTKHEILQEENAFRTRRVEFVTEDIENRADALTRMYIIEMLKEYRMLLNQNINRREGDRKLLFIDEVMGSLPANKFFGVPIIEIIYYEILTIKEPQNSDNYFILKGLAEKYSEGISYIEKYNVYVMLLNFANYKVGHKDDSFRSEVFELHKTSVRKNAIAKEGFIAPLRFEAMVEDALKIKEYDWLDGFILNYKHMLPEDERDDMVYYCLARISYSRKELEKALEYLANTNFSHVTMNLRKRNFTARLYFELDYLDTLLSFIDTYRHYLSNNETHMPPRVFEYYMNYVKVIPELVKLKSLPEQERLDKLRLKLSKLENIYDKSWLLEMLQVLEGTKIYKKKV